MIVVLLMMINDGDDELNDDDDDDHDDKIMLCFISCIVSLCINGSQLAKMKKNIPDTFLP